METSGQNKAVGLQSIKYVGHKEAVQHPTNGPTYQFPRNQAVRVPTSIAEALLKQPEKFQPAGVGSSAKSDAKGEK